MANTNEVDYPAEATIGDQWARGLTEESEEPILRSPRAELHHRIADVAYRLYLHRGKLHGHALEDWLAAESLVLSELVMKRAGGLRQWRRTTMI
jgi:hypothetical protein